MQKLSEELAGIHSLPTIILSVPDWESILKRIASLEREIEGERTIQRDMGRQLARQEGTIYRLTNERVALKAELKQLKKEE